MAWQLRARGINTEVSPTAAKYGKQIKYAVTRGIPYVWFVESGEVKNLINETQESAQADTFTPAPELLKPQVIANYE